MSTYKGLAERFNEKVNQLYSTTYMNQEVDAKGKYADGRLSNGRFDQPLMVRGPGESRRGIRHEGRALPFVSAPADVVRLTKFSLSGDGLKFYAKQQLLQTGNVFEQTRLLNPLFVIGNAIPFLHIRRHARPVTGPFGIAASKDSVRINARLLGQLQRGTFDKAISRYKLYRGGANLPGIRERLGAAMKSLASPLTSTFSALRAKRDVGEEGGRSSPGDDNGWNKSRPELETIVPLVQAANREFQDNTDKFFAPPDPEDPLSGGFGGGSFGYLQGIEGASGALLGRANAQPFLKYFSGGAESIKNRLPNEMNARDRAADARLEKRRISYIRDPLNLPPEDPSENVLPRYSILKTLDDINGKVDDPITVSFAMGNKAHVQFRAYISDLTQTISPNYKKYQYIGRIEQFVMYTSVERNISFGLKVLAYSKEELDVVWERINYLTAFSYPHGYNKGILQPNIIRFTIGDVFNDQPGYVTSFSTSFNEPAPTWDIDREVPIGASLKFSIMIIEKKSMTAESRFYNINRAETLSGPGRVRVRPAPTTPEFRAGQRA